MIASISSSDISIYSSPSIVTSVPAKEPNRTVSPFFTWNAAFSPDSNCTPSPRAMTLPCFGFSLAVSGRTMPPAVFSSASSLLTRTLSPVSYTHLTLPTSDLV